MRVRAKVGKYGTLVAAGAGGVTAGWGAGGGAGVVTSGIGVLNSGGEVWLARGGGVDRVAEGRGGLIRTCRGFTVDGASVAVPGNGPYVTSAARCRATDRAVAMARGGAV